MDKRKPWAYRSCQIAPRTGGPRYFGVPEWKEGATQYRTRWWKVRFLNGTWVFCGTKQECRDAVDRKYPHG